MARAAAGSWLAARGQPAAYRGTAWARALRGFIVPDRAAYVTLETNDEAYFALADRPFLTHVACAAPLVAVAAKVLLAPLKARTGGELVRLVPMSWRGAVRTTKFGTDWVVFATASRVEQVALAEGEVFAVQDSAAVAWTTKRPTGFVPRLRLRDVLLPRRRPEGVLMHFYGPGVVWFEGGRLSG